MVIMADFSKLVSPFDGISLNIGEENLYASDGTKYPISDNIADLLDERLLDEALMNEVDVFENLHIQNVCYFRQEVTDRAISGVLSRYSDSSELSFVEIGGGEGYLASAFKRACPDSHSYVCDVSKAALKKCS